MDDKQIVEQVASELGISNEVTKEFIAVCLYAVRRFDKKQQIFTTDNVNDWGLIGLASKLGHYQSELKKYLSVGEENRSELGLTDQKIDKNFMDMGIYSFIAYIYRQGKWKE